MYRALPGSLVAFFDKPASLGFTFAGALGQPGLLPTLQGGILACLPPAGAHISPFSRAVRVNSLSISGPKYSRTSVFL